jgi:hypothetical protein
MFFNLEETTNGDSDIEEEDDSMNLIFVDGLIERLSQGEGEEAILKELSLAFRENGDEEVS